MCRIGHLQGAALVAVRTSDGKFTLQWRTATRAAPCKRIGMYTKSIHLRSASDSEHKSWKAAAKKRKP